MATKHVVAVIEVVRTSKPTGEKAQVEDRYMETMTLPMPSHQTPLVFAQSLQQTGITIWPEGDDDDQIVEHIPPHRIYSLNWVKQT